MADFKIHLGTKLNTSDINTQISKYKASPINIKANLDTSDITKAINSYKSKPISIDSKLNTDGITEKIRAYTPPKKIHLESDLSTAGIDKKINNYIPKNAIKVDAELTTSSINQQIREAKPTESIKINAELSKSAISEAIRNYKATTPIKVMVDPDFSRVDALVKNYIPRNLLRVNVKLNKSEIDGQIKNFQTSTKIEVGAKLRENAIETAIKRYAGKELVPITVDFKVGETKEITNKINEYKNESIPIFVKLRPAQTGFDSEIMKKPVRVQATLDPDGIDSAIDKFNPTSRIKVGVKLDPKDINGQVAKLPKPTDSLDVDVRLNSNSINNAITKFTPTSRLKVGVDLKTDDINQQIDAIHPTSEIKVNVNLDNSDINTEIGRQNTQTPAVINVKLDRDKLNEQIRNFKTQTKLKVGVKLDFVGIPKQIKDYKTKSKIKVGVELDRDDIAREIATVETDTPIKLGVELNPEGVERVKGQVKNLKQQIEALGNVRINLDGSVTGATANSGNSTVAKNANTVRTNVAQGIVEADIKITNMEKHVDELSGSLKKMGFEKSAIDGITKELEAMDIVVNRVVTRLDKNKNMMLTIMGTDKANRRNVTLTKGVDVEGQPVQFTKVSQKIGETERFLKRQENAVARLTNQINEANRKAIDPNANHSIKEKEHLNELEAQYKAIINAIQQMGNASSDTFNAEKNKVESLISEYKSLVSEYRNAENVSIDYDGENYSTGLEKAKNELIKFKREAKEFPQMTQTVKELDDAFAKVGDAGSLQDFTRQLSVADSALKNIQAEANEANRILTDAWKKIDSLSIQAARLNPEANPKQLAELSKQLEEAEADYESLKRAFSSKLSTSQFGTLQANADDLTKKLDAIEKKHQDTRAELAKKINIHLEAGKFTEQVTRAYSNANRLADTSQELRVKLEALHNAQTDMNNAFNSSNVDEQIAAYRRYLKILEDVQNQIKINKIQERDAVDAQKLTLSKQGLSSDMTSWLRENSAAAKRFGDDIRRLQVQLKTCDNSVDFNNIKSEFRNVQKEAKALGLTGLTTFDKLKYKLKEYMAYFSVAEVFMYASQGLRDMFEQVKAIDSAMTELKKVTNETDAAYSQFLENAASRAKEIGTTIDGLVSSTADFARLGYGFKDAQGLAEVANIYAVVGDEIESVETATESLISTMAAFKDQADGMSNSDFAMSIIDKFNEIGNNFAISSGGIGEALERSASSLNAANNTIDESIALITAANTVVQSPDTVGTAFKTISMRIRGAKTELEEAGLETEGMVESTASLRQEILALSGVDIMENANEFKSTYKIMDELAAKWEDLTDIQQASITELIAGKRQGNIVSSLMTNFDVAREALETSLNSSGSALEEHEKWQKSLEAQTLKLEAAWQSLSQTFMSSKFLHGALEAIIGLVDGIEALVDTIGVIPTLATAFGIFQSFKGKGIFQPIIDEATGASKGITSIFGKAANSIKTSLNNINISNGFSASLNQDDVTSLIAYNGQLQAGIDKTTAWNDCMVNASQAAQNAARSNAFLSDGLNGYIKSQQAATVSTLAQNKSLSSAKALLNEYYSGCKTTGMGVDDFRAAVQQTNPQLAAQMTAAGGATKGLFAYAASTAVAKAGALALKIGVMALNATLTMGIGLIVGELMSAVTSWINKEKDLAEEVEEVTTKFNEQHKSLQKMKGDFDTDNESSMISRYAKLSKGVDRLGQNLSLTSDEYSEYLGIVDKIADTFPSLVNGYDAQGNAILKCKDNVSELTKEYERLIEANADSVLKDNLSKIAEDFENKLDSKNGQSFWESVKSISSMGGMLYTPSIELTDVALHNIKRLLNSKDKGEDAINQAIQDTLSGADALHDYSSQIITALQAQNVDIDYWNYEEKLKEIISTNPQKLQAIIDEYEVDMEAFASSMKAITTATLTKAFDISGSEYYDMSDTLKSLMYNIVNSFDVDFYKKYQANPEGIIDYIHDMLGELNSVEGEIETAFNLKTQFNNNEIPYGDYAKGVQNIKDTIDGLKLDDEVKQAIKLTLDDGEITTQYNQIRKYLYNLVPSEVDERTEKEISDFLNSLTAEELAAVIDIRTEIDWKNTSAEDIRKQIEDRVKLNEALNFEADIEIDKTALKALNTALEESASAMGLSEESIDSLKSKYSELEGYNPHTLFEKTANGVKVNREELAKLEKKYNDLTKTEVQEHLDALVEEYNKCTEAIDDNIGYQEKLELISKREKYAQQIEELAEYQAQLEGVTGAYQKWLDAQNTPEDYEGYEGIATSKEDIQEEIDRGFIGNKSKAYIDLLSGENLEGKSIDDYYAAWERLDQKVGSTSYSIHDFFTVNDDGDITSTGIDRFFKGLQQDFKGSVAKFNEESGKWEYNFSQENLQKIQDEWGIGIEAIELLLEAAAAAGYDIDWGGIFDDLDIDTSNFESVEAMISLAEKAQEEFNKLKGVEDVEFNFRTNTIEEATTEVEKARKAYLDLITNKDGSINLKAEGAEQMQFMLSTLITQKQLLSTPAIMKVDTSQIDKAKTDVIEVINKAKELQTAYENYEIAITTGVDVESAKKDLNSAIDGMKGTSVDVRADLKLPTNEELEAAKGSIGDIKVGAKLDGTAISDMATKIQTECTPEVIAKVTGLDESAIDGGSQQVVYTAEHSDVDAFIDSLSDISKKIIYTYTTEGTKPNPSNIERSITYKYKTEGDVPEVNGTANANGTANSSRAFVRGNWGIKGSGTALVGELGMETLVRGGRFYTIGDNGAEFIKYKQGDIIFNHKQTEELFKNGKITSDGGRGRMFADGSAYVEGTALWNATASGSKFASNRLNKKTTKKAEVKTKTLAKKDVVETTTTTTIPNAKATETDYSQNNAATSEDKLKTDNAFEETFDWIAIAIERIEREIDNLDKTVGNVYKSWSDRNNALKSEIAKVGEEITLQENAADKYLTKANAIGLDSSYINKIQNGTLNIEDFEGKSDEALVEKIKEYQKWYALYLGCIDKAEELKQAEAELWAQRFDNVISKYEGILQGFEHTESMLDEYISQAEAKGYIVSKEYYDALKTNKQSELNKLIEEQSALITKRNEAEANGINKNSEEWYDMCAEIDGVTQAIESGTTALIEYDNAMRDIDWEVFDLIQERISDVAEEANFLINLMSYDKLFDDNGKLTDKGIATMGLHGQNYNTYMYQADDYGNKVKEIDAKIVSGELDGYSKDVLEKRQEYLELQRESILAAEDEKQAIKDLIEEGINLELDALQERIDLHNEELESMKDLYDYQKNVEEQTKNIASLQKQLHAYEGFNDEETRATVQKLKVELESAQQDLQKTEYDKYIADQTALLDELFLEYKNVLNTRLDDTNGLITQVIDAVNIAAGAEGTIATALGAEGAIAKELAANGVTIKSTLETEAKNVGTTLSNAMEGIWSVDEGNAKSVLTTYGEGFQGKQTTTNTILDDIKANINRMVDDVDTDATTKVNANKTTTSAKKDPTKKTNSTQKKKTTTTKKSTGGDGTPKIGDKVKFLSGKYYYDSQGKTPAGSKNHGKQVYITNINKRSWATHPYHISTGKKLGSGDLGWLKLNQISGYAAGKKNFLNNEIAWTQENGKEFIIRPSDGAVLTPIAKGDSVLTSAASNNIWDMANSPAEFIKDNLNLGTANVPNNSTVQSNYTQHLDKVVFNLPNVKNYEELLSAMQRDKNFERLILSMTVDQIAGKSSLAKGKSIR